MDFDEANLKFYIRDPKVHIGMHLAIWTKAIVWLLPFRNILFCLRQAPAKKITHTHARTVRSPEDWGVGRHVDDVNAYIVIYIYACLYIYIVGTKIWRCDQHTASQMIWVERDQRSAWLRHSTSRFWKPNDVPVNLTCNWQGEKILSII